MPHVPGIQPGGPRSPSYLQLLSYLATDLPHSHACAGFNEPDNSGQANLTPLQAAKYWPQVQAVAASANLTLVSPALTYGGYDSFQVGAHTRGLKVGTGMKTSGDLGVAGQAHYSGCSCTVYTHTLRCACSHHTMCIVWQALERQRVRVAGPVPWQLLHRSRL